MPKTTKSRAKQAARAQGEASMQVYQRIAEGWDPSCKACTTGKKPCGAHPRDIKTAAKIQREELRASMSPARAVPIWIVKEARAANDFEARSLLCAKILAKGEWSGLLVSEALRTVWGVERGAISNYLRAGAVVVAASRGDNQELLEDTLGMYRRQERECIHVAHELEGEGRQGEASRYRDLAQKARARMTEVTGLLQHRLTISLEADPRIAGLYAAQLAALEDFDRLVEQRDIDARRREQALLAEIERLTGGVLPAGLPEPPAALPSAQDHVRDAVKRYEAEIGARKLAA